MVEFNLLPWRAYYREYVKTQWIKYIAIVMAIGLIIFIIDDIVLSKRVAKEKQAISRIKITKSQSVASSDQEVVFLEALKTNHQSWQLFLDSVDFMSFPEISWENFSMDKNDIVMSGKTSALTSLFDFVKNNTLSADIINLKRLPQSAMIQFSVRFHSVFISSRRAGKQ